MQKRTTYEVKKDLFMLLREKPLSYTKLQTKLGTNYDSVKNICKELEVYDLVKVKELAKHPENGKPSFEVELTARGQEIAKKMKKDL
ncbi:hypothetical protein J4419_05760 [Candidatus Woesearchaeota archaeon]|nr:hypothetical protein [Candidatus Woesearchaeota archaeon]